ncbi:MAG: bifunctional adenosylcobinamide kinase/adenosylcobinamide-phosphate guanylyltransferase [Clostridia bacterium]|nr:bifunctional adenosylcobinamide kinase/adenosylcobinamide-phosphate guanylyltransferase [Clostridia bacterium]
MSVLISGGCKNGKSYYAQELARAMGAPLYYIATMIPHDAEDDARIERHRRERAGWGFETVECGRDILRALDGTDPSGAFLLDSTTALLSNEMFSSDGIDPTAGERVAQALCEFVRRAPNTVVVSDGIYSDANRYDAWTECYRRNLARIDCALAQVCDTVIEVVAGLKIVYRGNVLL